jgi:hypothetical protein
VDIPPTSPNLPRFPLKEWRIIFSESFAKQNDSVHASPQCGAEPIIKYPQNAITG